MPNRELDVLLDEHRDALEGLPGVVGTAVGGSAVHIYVALGTDPAHIRPEAERLLGGAPVEVIAMDTPEAQPD